MKNNEYLIVHKSILPEQFEQIIEAREMINKQNISVSDACKKTGISRSTFYKYKDYIFRPTKEQGNKASIAIMAIDKKGILSSVLQKVSEHGANVISINQDSPIDGMALITLTIDLSEVKNSINELIASLANIEGIKKVDMIGVE